MIATFAYYLSPRLALFLFDSVVLRCVLCLALLVVAGLTVDVGDALIALLALLVIRGVALLLVLHIRH